MRPPRLVDAQRQQYLQYRDEILPQALEVERMAEDSYRLGQTGIAALLQALQATRDMRLRRCKPRRTFRRARRSRTRDRVRPSHEVHLDSSRLVVSLACGVCRPHAASPRQRKSTRETVVPVTTEPARRRHDSRASSMPRASSTPAPGADLVVTAPEPARIAEMPKAEGDRVRRGDLLVRFEIPVARPPSRRQRPRK